MRPTVARVLSSNPQAYVRLDQYHGAALAVQIVMEGGPGSAQYSLTYSFQDPNDLVSPVPLADMAWDDSLIPAGFAQGTVSGTFYIPTSPIWGNLLWIGDVGM
jgi:hypothetical protein